VPTVRRHDVTRSRVDERVTAGDADGGGCAGRSAGADGRFVGVAKLTMRDFSDAFLDAYLDTCGDVLLGSVGGYHIEGQGAQLFARVDGDQFTIRGLPLLAVLDYLRTRSVMPI